MTSSARRIARITPPAATQIAAGLYSNRPPQGMKLAPLGSALTGATGRLSVARVADGTPAFSVGDPKGTRLELGKVQFGADFSAACRMTESG